MTSTKTVDLSDVATPCRLIGLFLTLHAWTFLLWYLLSRALSGMVKSFTAWNLWNEWMEMMYGNRKLMTHLVFSFVSVSLFKDIDSSVISFRSRQKTSQDVLKTSRAHFRNSCSCPHKSSPKTIFISRSPPNSPKMLSRNFPKLQKFGYADEPKANTANLRKICEQTLTVGV